MEGGRGDQARAREGGGGGEVTNETQQIDELRMHLLKTTTCIQHLCSAMLISLPIIEASINAGRGEAAKAIKRALEMAEEAVK